jgi:hypothetical protein
MKGSVMSEPRSADLLPRLKDGDVPFERLKRAL